MQTRVRARVLTPLRIGCTPDERDVGIECRLSHLSADRRPSLPGRNKTALPSFARP